MRELATRACKTGLLLQGVSSGKDRNFTFKDGSFKHLVNPHYRDTVFRDLIHSSVVETCIKQLVGNLAVFVTHSKLSYKIPGHKHVWLPHQDSGYKSVNRKGAYTLSIFLEKCTRGNGTLEVFPKSHLLGKLKHKWNSIEGERVPQLYVDPLPNIDPVPVNGDEGDVLVMDKNMIHQSGPNQTGGTRSIFIFEIEPVRHFAIDDLGHNAMVLNGEYPPLRMAVGPLVVFPVQIFERMSHLWQAEMPIKSKMSKVLNSLWRR